MSGRKHDALRLAYKTVGALDTYVVDVPTDTAASAAATAIVAATTIDMPITIVVAATTTTITSGYLQEPNLADAEMGTPIRGRFPRPARAASFGAAR